MAVTLLKRPQGVGLQTTPKLATVSLSGTDANFQCTSHGLVTGRFIFIVSSIRDYCGFWYVSKTDNNNFRCFEAAGSTTAVQYITNDTVSFYTQTLSSNHYWSCVHLPIVYKFTSNLWPINTADTIRTVSSAIASFGYTKITASGDIKTTGTANELDFITLYVNGIQGIYQIIQYISDTVFVIDLTFLGTNTYGNLQFYYNNYHIRVKIYAGIRATHKWASKKPLTYLVQVKLVPDSAGLITLNINEYLKDQIDILKNDNLIGTQPNDINAWCDFYVTYAESYDLSTDGYTVGSFVSSYTDDSATLGSAFNAKLPFKNRHSGYLSEYINYDSSLLSAQMKFLTLFDQPTIFNGFFFELDFLLSNIFADALTNSQVVIVQATYKNGFFVANYETLVPILLDAGPVYNYGLMRIGLTVKGTEDQQRVFLAISGNLVGSTYSPILSEIKTLNVNNDCAPQSIEFQWLNYLGGRDQFVFSTMKDYGIDITDTKENTQSVMGTWPDSYGENASTINRNIERTSNQSITVYSQNLTETEIDGLAFLKTSPLVQIYNSVHDIRTVIIDKSSFVKKKDGDKTYYLTFKASYTDDIPSQSL